MTGVASERAGTSGSVLETALRFGPEDRLAGIVSHASGRATAGGALPVPLLILGAGIIHKVGPSRISVELARTLARAGHTVLRFDLSGIGDSGRAGEASLQAAVVEDIRAAVSCLLQQSPRASHVGVVGFCSGADNGFHMAGEDRRIRAVAMFDPTVHSTPGFHRRNNLRRLRSARSWMNVLSGRSIWLRAKQAVESNGQRRPPGYYGLLVSGAAETDRRAADLVAADVRLLYCLSSGAHGYCNAPEQVSESLPTGFSPEHIQVTWRPDLDHVLSEPRQRVACGQVVLSWLESLPG